MSLGIYFRIRTLSTQHNIIQTCMKYFCVTLNFIRQCCIPTGKLLGAQYMGDQVMLIATMLFFQYCICQSIGASDLLYNLSLSWISYNEILIPFQSPYKEWVTVPSHTYIVFYSEH